MPAVPIAADRGRGDRSVMESPVPWLSFASPEMHADSEIAPLSDVLRPGSRHYDMAGGQLFGVGDFDMASVAMLKVCGIFSVQDAFPGTFAEQAE